MKLAEKIYQKKTLGIVLFSIAVLVGIQKYSRGPSRYDNYLIFKTSFLDLISGLDLYGQRPSEFLYSPTFAFLMAPFAALPDLLGIILWCVLNSFAVYCAIISFPTLDIRKKILVLGIVFFEFITAQQNLQTNPLIAALIILCFTSFEKRKPFLAALFMLLSFYVKIYGIVAAGLFLLYPDKIKFILSCIFWGLVLFLLPLVVVSFGHLIDLYKSWFHFTQTLHDNAATNFSSSLNSKDPALSVMSLIHAWFGVNWNSLYIQLAGGLLLMLPFSRVRQYGEIHFRKLLLASVLIFCVVFNHMAESASYVIAMFGVAIWFVDSEKNKITITLFVLAFVLTSLSPTDLFPRFIRESYIKPYVLKAFPCILIWLFIQYKLLAENFTKHNLSAHES